MSVNLAKKYEAQVAERFAKGSITASAVNQEYQFNGVRSVTVYTIDTAPLGEYVREGTARYGNPNDLGDTTQELVMTQDKAFTYIIDKGDDNEQMNVKGAAKLLRRQIDEVISPHLDQYRLKVWTKKAGTIAAVTAPTETTIVGQIMDATTALDNALTPESGRTLFIPANYYRMLKHSSEFISSETLAEEALAKGVVGMIDGMKVVKVPQSWVPSGVYWLITHDSAVLGVAKLQDYKIHSDPPGINGNLVEGRLIHDAFVLGSKCGGVYCAVSAGMGTSNPAIEANTNNSQFEISCTSSGASIFYTLDGSDPRYSGTVKQYSSPIPYSQLNSGDVISAYAVKSSGYASGVVKVTYNG
jgi:hypothetical protein